MGAKHLLAMAVASALVSACTGGETPSSSSSAQSTSSITDESSSVSSVASSQMAQSSSQSSSSSAGTSSSVATGSISQFVDLPNEFRISDDGERLERGGFYSPKLYEEERYETVYLDFPQDNYKQLLANNYDSKTEIPATLRYRDKVFEQVGVRYRGQTSYSMANEKKSFSIDLEYAIDGQDLNGYNELKLNNGYEDPSLIREVLYSNLIRKNIPAARANHVQLVINGENYGVYANVEKLEKDHVKDFFFDKDNTRWRCEGAGGFGGGGFGGGGFGGGFGGGGFDFASVFGAGQSTLNDLGPNGSDYEQAYTLKSADLVDPWQDLANAAHTMGTAPQSTLIADLEDYLDIDEALWFVASENIFIDEDGYIFKGGMDYYAYFNLFTNELLPIEYDGNSSFHVQYATQWNPLYRTDDDRFPLMNILLNNPELRQRYLAHYRTLLEEAFKPEVSFPYIDRYAAKINDGIAAPDALRQYSYGQYQSEISRIKDFITQRYNWLIAHNELAGQPVTIANVVDSVDGVASVRPRDDQSVQVAATIQGNTRAAYLYYGTGLDGRFTKVAMSNNGGTYTANIPPMPKGEFVRYYVQAVANDNQGSHTYSPVGAEHDVYIYQVQAAAQVASPVVINELVADNATLVATNEGEYEDWIELYNNSDQAVDVSGWYLTDEDTQLDRWALPQGSVIPAGGTLVVWADDEADTLGGLHASFKLSAGGEYVYLVTPELNIADSVEFSDAPEDQSYARSPNGTGAFSWTTNVSFDALNP